MRTYVLGAGASYPIYPLVGFLFEQIDGFIKSCGKCFDRFNYDKEWPATLKWLGDSASNKLTRTFRSATLRL